MRSLQGWHVEQLAVGRDRQPIAAAVVLAIPENAFRLQIDRDEPLDGCDVEHSGFRAGGDSFHVLRLFAGGRIPGRNALDEFVALVDIEHQNTHAAVLHVIAYARTGDIQQVLLLGGLRLIRAHQNGYPENDQELASFHIHLCLWHIIQREEDVVKCVIA